MCKHMPPGMFNMMVGEPSRIHLTMQKQLCLVLVHQQKQNVAFIISLNPLWQSFSAAMLLCCKAEIGFFAPTLLFLLGSYSRGCRALITKWGTLYVTLCRKKARNFFVEWPFAFDGDHGPMATSSTLFPLWLSAMNEKKCQGIMHRGLQSWWWRQSELSHTYGKGFCVKCPTRRLKFQLAH